MRISIPTKTPTLRAENAAAIPLWREDISSSVAPIGFSAASWKEVRAWIQSTRFRAKAEEFSHTRIPVSGGCVDLFLLGLGNSASISAGAVRRLGGRLAAEARRLGLTRLDILLGNRLQKATLAAYVRALTTGLREGSYRLRKSESKDTPADLAVVQIFLNSADSRSLAKREAEIGAEIGETINVVRDIANRPGNEAPPRVIAREARILAKTHGLSCTIWNRAELKRQRCRALLAVAQGSREEPCLIRLTYPGRKRNLPPLVVVGKTITFDTGGISLKPGKNMEWMKFDKSGGMTVLAFMSLVGSVIKPDRPVIGLLAAAENMPGSAATRPGDVVRSRNGKTIEIVNTDAEGRLVLADALDVALSFKPACIIDLATLTGAAMVALGRPASAIMSNHLGLRESLQAAGEACGDRLWPLPLYPEYEHMIKSPFADMKNIGDGSAGTIVGGIFLQSFVRPDVPWAHIDLTSAWEERTTAHGPAGATLFGVALLSRWLESSGPEQL